MTDILYAARQVIFVTTAPICSVITAMVLATLPSSVQRKYPHQEHHTTMTDHNPNHIMTTALETDHSPFITDTAKEVTFIGHTTDLIMTEAPATIRGMHATPSPTTTAAHSTHPPKDALGNNLNWVMPYQNSHDSSTTCHSSC